MIKLSSGFILLQDCTGAETILNLDDLRRELWQCCRAVSEKDEELPDDVVAVVRSFVDQNSDMGVSFSRQDIDEMIIRILFDSGLSPIAAEFRDRRQIVVPADPGTLIEPSLETVSGLLRRDPFFLSKPIARLSQRIVEAVATLALRETTERFVVEFGKTLWQHWVSEHGRPSQARPASFWMLHRSEIPPLFTADDASLVATGTIGFSSVSSLLPTIRVTVCMDHVVEQQSNDLVTELALYPAFDSLCRRLCSMLHSVRQELDRRESAAVQDGVRTVVRFVRLADLATEVGCSGQRSGLQRELLSIADHHLKELERLQLEFD